MAIKEWEQVQVRTCAKATKPIEIDQLVIYPIDYLPDPPRVVDFRCSGEVECGKNANVYCIVPEKPADTKKKP